MNYILYYKLVLVKKIFIVTQTILEKRFQKFFFSPNNLNYFFQNVNFNLFSFFQGFINECYKLSIFLE